MMQRLGPRPLNVARLERIEGACSRFEEEWQQGRSPDAAAYLAEAEPADRPELLRELLLVEWSHREKLGKALDVEEHRRRFAAHAAVVEEAWRSWGELSTTGLSPETVAPSTALPDGLPTDPRPAPSLPPGLAPPVLPGYTDVVELGRGGMGVVYRARDSELERLVALKMIHADRLTPEQRERFRLEAKALARLAHPHIVAAHGWETTAEGWPVLVMEYVPGQSLHDRLKRPVTPAEAARLVAVLARAVQAAHTAGIVHRDLKPANVLLAAPVPGNAGTVLGGFPKVSDFGLARLVESETGQTLSGAVLGTPSYMAPEQARGSREVGPPADVWALGVILFQSLTGKLPFAGDSILETLERIKAERVPALAELAPGVPANLAAICSRCLEKEAARRPSAAELAEMLEGLVDVPQAPLPAGEERSKQPLPPTTSPKRRGGERQPLSPDLSPHRRWTAGAIAAGVLVAGAALALVIAGRRGPAAKEEGPGKPPAVAVEAQLSDKEGQKRSKDVVSPALGDQRAQPELKVRLSVAHVVIAVQNGEKVEAGSGVIGRTSFAAGFGDGVRVEASLSAPGHAYLVALNADGKEQLLWPVNDRGAPDESAVPPRLEKFAFPPQPSGLFYLDDDPAGGLQVLAVLASRRPLPSYAEWKQQRGALPWRKQKAGAGVWVADLKGTYPRAKGQLEDRGSVGERPGMPPLGPLGRALNRGGVEQVEMLSFPVRAKEAGR
jgi:serine/threonine protein kinase